MRVEIFDIDGTLTTTGNNPNEAVIEHIRTDASEGTEIIIVSARPVSRMQETRTWLEAHDVPHARVYLNDFEGAGQGPNVGIAFKEYKYKQIVEEFGLEDIDYAVDNDPEVRAMAQRLGIEAYSPEEFLSLEGTEERAVYEVPDYVSSAANQGLAWYEEGLAGDGLQPETVAEARELAAGRADSDKLIRMAAWIRRHRGDWEGVAQNNDPTDDRFPAPGAVAGFLWGVRTTQDGAADRVLVWADRLIAAEMAQNTEENSKDDTTTVVRSEHVSNIGATEERYDLKEKEIRSLAAGEFRVSDAGNGQRTLTGYASLFNRESAGLPFTEIIAPGAFKRSIARANAGERVISLLFGHDETRALATTLSGRLKLTEDEMGLRVEAQLDPADPDAASVLSKVANESAAMGWSFGFNTPKGGDAWDGNIRTLKEVILGEVSILSAGQQPAYPQTIGGSALRHVAKDILGVDGDLVSDTMEAIKLGETLNEDQTAALDQIRVKLGAKMEERATWTTGAARDLSVNEDRSWDGQGAADRVFAAAGFDSESPDYEMARKAFLVYDADAPELRGSYKLGFVDIVDGELVAIRDGLRAAASRLPLTDIPQDAAERARAVLDSYFGSRSVHPSVAEAQVILAWMTNETI